VRPDRRSPIVATDTGKRMRLPCAIAFASLLLFLATFETVPGTELQSPDISDNRVVNWIWELRVGLAWRLR
jgi:hypothetical protein